MTKVKGVGYHQGQVMDVADYVFPSQVCAADNAGGDTVADEGMSSFLSHY